MAIRSDPCFFRFVIPKQVQDDEKYLECACKPDVQNRFNAPLLHALAKAKDKP
jgi:hypothetical protein